MNMEDSSTHKATRTIFPWWGFIRHNTHHLEQLLCSPQLVFFFPAINPFQFVFFFFFLFNLRGL